MSKYKFLFARGQIMVAKNSPWRLRNVQLVLIVAVVEVYLQEDSFHFYIKKISAGQEVRHLLANSFEVSILNHFLRTWNFTITTNFTSRHLATSYEILVARTEVLVALATRKAQFRTLPTIVILRVLIVLVSTREPNQSSLENIKCKRSQMNITLNVGSKEDLIRKYILSGHI